MQPAKAAKAVGRDWDLLCNQVPGTERAGVALPPTQEQLVALQAEWFSPQGVQVSWVLCTQDRDLGALDVLTWDLLTFAVCQASAPLSISALVWSPVSCGLFKAKFIHYLSNIPILFFYTSLSIDILIRCWCHCDLFIKVNLNTYQFIRIWSHKDVKSLFHSPLYWLFYKYIWQIFQLEIATFHLKQTKKNLSQVCVCKLGDTWIYQAHSLQVWVKIIHKVSESHCDLIVQTSTQ